jgi:hypothetical protein
MNPILLKELRATFRGWKFLAVHLGFLALMSIGLVVVILSLSDVARTQPSRIGQGIHQVFLCGSAMAILLILPAFASTALVTEREQNTFELLQTTSLNSRAIVRGKFLASMTYTTVFLFSALPVGVLAFLFGGVTVGTLALAYAGLLALSAITNIFSIFISAQARTSRSALMGTAAFGVVLAIILMAYFFALPRLAFREQAASLLGFARLLGRSHRFIPSPDLDSFLYLLALPGFVMVSLFAFSAVSATNRLKTRAGNRSTNLKLFFLGFMFCGAGLWLLMLFRAKFGTTWERWLATTTFFGALGVVATLSSFFAAEDPVSSLPPRLRAVARFPLLRPLRPGASNGFLFTLSVNALLLLPVVFILAEHLRTDRALFMAPMFGLVSLILAFLFLSGSAGVFLSTVVKNERVRMALQSGVVTLVIFLPLILYAVLHHFERLPTLPLLEPGLLSPVVAFGSLTTGFFEFYGAGSIPTPAAEAGTIFPYEISLGKVHFPAFAPTILAYLVLGTVLFALARKRTLAREAAGEAREREDMAPVEEKAAEGPETQGGSPTEEPAAEEPGPEGEKPGEGGEGEEATVP